VSKSARQLGCGRFSARDYTTQNLSARQRDVMNLIVRGLSSKEISSILNLAEGLTAKECLQNAEVCLALAHKTKELDTRAALLAFAYEFRTVAKRLQRSASSQTVCKNRPGRGQVESNIKTT
jgi:FixJ family two-component response regulator